MAPKTARKNAPKAQAGPRPTSASKEGSKQGDAKTTTETQKPAKNTVAAKKNPFTLAEPAVKRVDPPVAKPERKVYAAEQIDKLLEDFREVDRKDWGGVLPGTMVRYYEGESFRFGGIVEGNYANAKTEEKQYIKFRLPFGKNPAMWSVNVANISRLFVLPNREVAALENRAVDAVDKLNGNMQKIAEAIRALEARANALDGRLTAVENAVRSAGR